MRRISTIFIGTILICLIFVVGILSVLTTNSSKEAIEAESHKRLESTAIYAAEKIEKQLGIFQNQMDTLALGIKEHFNTLTGTKEVKAQHILEDYDAIFKQINEVNSEAIASYLVINYEYLPYEPDNSYPFQVVYIKDTNNINEKATLLATQLDFQSHEPYMAWFHNPITAGRGVWSDIYSDEFVSDTIITYSVPIISDGEIIAIVGLDIRFENFEEIVTNVQIYETGYAFLMNENFDYLVHPKFNNSENLVTVEDGQYAYMKDLFNEDHSGIIKYQFYNQEKILAFTHLENNWIVAVAPPIEEFFYFYYDLRDKQYGYIISGIIISAFIAGGFGYYISKPLSQVAKHIESTSTQHFSSSEILNGKHFVFEVDLLYKNFSKMTTRLQDAFKEIQHHNENLEGLVESRTKDLKQSNLQLKQSIKELKTTQGLLITAKKDEEINILIKNITHNLNTPLGNAITTYSYLKQLLSQNGYSPKISQSVAIIESCLMNMRNIIDSLNILTLDYENVSISNISLKTLLTSQFEWHKSQYKDIDINYDIILASNSIISTNKKMLLRLVDSLISYCFIKNEHLYSVKYSVEVLPANNGFVIVFEDNLTSYSEISSYFYNNDFRQMNMSNFNIDLHLLHVIITSGLSGEVELHSTNQNKVQWHIILPNK